MEHVDGVPITKYAETHGLTVSQRLDLFLQACDAVQYAHRNLTVHRDLKPSNILVTEAGAVKLLDFGVAKLIETEAGTADAPPTEALLTPAYTSPSRFAANRPPPRAMSSNSGFCSTNCLPESIPFSERAGFLMR